MAVLIAVAGGLAGGLVGVGGGILFVPALTIFLGLTQVEARVDLAADDRHRRPGRRATASTATATSALREALIIGVLSPLGVLVGVVVANHVSERVLQLSFAALALFMAAQLVRRARSAPASAPSATLKSVDSLTWEGDLPQLRSPVLVCAFRGWNDAAAAASTALGAIADSLDAELIAQIDPEEFFDFQSTRPTISLERGPDAPHRVAGEQPDRGPRRRPPTATSSCSTGPSRTCAGAPSRRRSRPPPTRSGSSW